MKNATCDLLVVGLGPVGDVMAGLAKLRGLSVIAIDREAGIYPLPRAAVFDQEIMRIFQMLGVSERIASACRVPPTYRFLTAKGETLLDFPVRDGAGKWGWAETYALHQPAVEEALRERLTELGVDVRTRTTFKGCIQDDEKVVAEVEGPDGSYSIEARYLVGCDGAWSPVRETMGTTLFDYQFDEPWLVIDAIVEDDGDLPQICLQICNPERPTTFMRMSGQRYRWEFMLKPGEDPTAFASDESLHKLLKPWNCLDRMMIERRAVYRFHGLVARDWRRGRVLIAGDAAHQMPPFAGQGMCSGIRDCMNLGWKIAKVLKGEASDDLLDSYQQEREPHVRAIIETAIAMGRVVCMLDLEAAAKRDAEMLARKATGAQDVSMDYPPLESGFMTEDADAGALFIQPLSGTRRLDDVLGDDAWLIGRGLPSAIPAGVVAVDLDKEAVEGMADPIRAWLTERGVEAVLVRPDRHIFGTGDAAALAAEWQRRLMAA